jgi:subtilase family serine protease
VESGEIVKVIDTESYVVDPDVTVEIQTFFNPVVGGQYEVSGKVFYNNKLTLERSTLINVNGAPVPASRNYTTLIITAMIIIILALLILIRRRRAA